MMEAKELMAAMQAERDDLTVKVADLRAYMSGTDYAELYQAEQQRITQQMNFMMPYLAVLGERIAAQ